MKSATRPLAACVAVVAASALIWPQGSEAAPPALQPAAVALYNSVGPRYQKMRSYSEEMTLRVKNRGAFPAQLGTSFKARVRWQSPFKVRIERTDGPKALGVSDGKTLWALNAAHQGTYLKRKLAFQPIFSAANESGLSGPGMGFFNGTYGLDSLKRQGLKEMKLGQNAFVKGVPCRTIVLSMASTRDENSTWTLFIGQKDGLLHQLAMVVQSSRGKAFILENHDKIRVNSKLSASTWKFAPPAGARPVAAFPRPR